MLIFLIQNKFVIIYVLLCRLLRKFLDRCGVKNNTLGRLKRQAVTLETDEK